MLEIVVTTSQSDDLSRAVATDKSGPEVDGGLHNRSNPIPNHAILVTSGVEVIPRVVGCHVQRHSTRCAACNAYLSNGVESFEPFFCTATFHSFPPSIGSSLPQDSCVFQWDRNAIAVRYHSRRVVRCYPPSLHGSVTWCTLPVLGLPERECVLRYDRVSWARGIILFSVVLTGTLFCDPALSQDPDSSGNTPKIQRSEEKCIKPPPLFDVNEFPGPIKKTAAYLSRKLERKTVPQPPRRAGYTICALEPRQRFALFVSDSSDRVSFAGRAFTTGWAQFRNDEPKLGQGTKGYAKRYGVATMDQFSKGFFTTFLYPSIFKEDPRYYRMGQGPFQNRLIHAMSHIIVAHQNSGVEMFNFSEWFGVTTSVALRNLYHPDRLRGFRPAALRVETGLVSDMSTDIFREFWPEIARKLKIPFVSRDRSHDENH